MKKKIVIVAAVVVMLLLSVMPALAQDNNRTIEVIGTGTAFGTPDMATVEVGVDIRDADFGAAFQGANDTMGTVLAQILELGIAAEDVQTTSINVWIEENYDSQFGGSSGERIYHVTQSMRIVVRDTDAISDVISTAVDSGANQIFGLNFSFSDTDALETEARAGAVEDARVKAQQLADLMGVEVGEVQAIVEVGAGGSPIIGRGGAFDMMESAVISTGQLSVTTGVQVTFAIR